MQDQGDYGLKEELGILTNIHSFINTDTAWKRREIEREIEKFMLNGKKNGERHINTASSLSCNME